MFVGMINVISKNKISIPAIVQGNGLYNKCSYVIIGSSMGNIDTSQLFCEINMCIKDHSQCTLLC